MDVFASLDSYNKLVQHIKLLLSPPLSGVGSGAFVYALSSVKDTANYYIGSASNTMNRIGKHQDFILGNRSADGVNKLLLKAYPISDIRRWSVIYDSINY